MMTNRPGDSGRESTKMQAKITARHTARRSSGPGRSTSIKASHTPIAAEISMALGLMADVSERTTGLSARPRPTATNPPPRRRTVTNEDASRADVARTVHSRITTKPTGAAKWPPGDWMIAVKGGYVPVYGLASTMDSPVPTAGAHDASRSVTMAPQTGMASSVA